jgi:hypothetical protein
VGRRAATVAEARSMLGLADPAAARAEVFGVGAAS